MLITVTTTSELGDDELGDLSSDLWSLRSRNTRSSIHRVCSGEMECIPLGTSNDEVSSRSEITQQSRWDCDDIPSCLLLQQYQFHVDIQTGERPGYHSIKLLHEGNYRHRRPKWPKIRPLTIMIVQFTCIKVMPLRYDTATQAGLLLSFASLAASTWDGYVRV